MEREGEISCIQENVCHKVVLISAGASHSVALLGKIFIYLWFMFMCFSQTCFCVLWVLSSFFHFC